MSEHRIIFTLERDGKRFIKAFKFTNTPIAYYGIKHILDRFWWMDVKVYKTSSWRVLYLYPLVKIGYYKII